MIFSEVRCRGRSGAILSQFGAAADALAGEQGCAERAREGDMRAIAPRHLAGLYFFVGN